MAKKRRSDTKSNARGPLPGAANAGRPTKSKRKKKPAAARKKKPAATGFADYLAALTDEQIATLAGEWQSLEPQDRLLLAILQESIARYRQLSARIHDGRRWTFATESGYEQQIPEFALLNKALDQILTIGAKFGLSPGDRLRNGTAPTPEPTGPNAFAAHMAAVGALSAEVAKRSTAK